MEAVPIGLNFYPVLKNFSGLGKLAKMGVGRRQTASRHRGAAILFQIFLLLFEKPSVVMGGMAKVITGKNPLDFVTADTRR